MRSDTPAGRGLRVPYLHGTCFAAGPTGGIEAAVIPPEVDAPLNDSQRLSVASATGLASTTTFVSSVQQPDDSADGCALTLRYFTHELEVSICVHSTIACLGLLHEPCVPGIAREAPGRVAGAASGHT